MASYQRILAQFQKLNYHQHQHLHESDLNKALDALSSKNTGIRQFDREITQELWDHTDKDQSNTVQLKNYINTIVEAERILKEQIEIVEESLRRSNEQALKHQLNSDLTDLLLDHNLLATTFNLTAINQSQMVVESKLNQNPIRQSHGQTAIFSSQNIEVEEPSPYLHKLFLLTLFILAWEFSLTFHKNNFYNLLLLCLVLSIYFLNYFDRNYVNFLLILVGIGIGLDFIWMLVFSGIYWESLPETYHSTLHTGFLRFIVVMTGILMALKVLLLVMLLKYRKVEENFKRIVVVVDEKFKIDGKPTYNLFTKFLVKLFDQ